MISLSLQALEDKTFGLKNKSKSAKVQGYAFYPSLLLHIILARCSRLLHCSSAELTIRLHYRYVQQLQKSATVNQNNNNNEAKKVTCGNQPMIHACHIIAHHML